MGKITVETCEIEGLKIITPTVFGDARGYFFESYHYEDYKAAGIPDVFVQDNQSASKRGVLRGLHFQIQHPQAKLVRVIKGEVYDVAVDLREGSKPMDSGMAFCSPRKIRSSFISRRILPTAFWFCQTMLSSATSVQTFIIPATKAASFITILQSV